MPLFLTVTLSFIGSPALTSPSARSVSTLTSSSLGSGPASLAAHVGPVDAELLQLGADLAPLFARNLRDEVLGGAHLVGALAGGHVGDEVARELDREVGSERVFGIAAALADRLAIGLREVVANELERLAVAGVRVGEVLREIALAQPLALHVDVHLERVDRHRVELDVGRDADALDGDVARGEVLRDGELERRLVGGDLGEDELHAALAEGLLADDDRAVVVLERAGDDLARAR